MTTFTVASDVSYAGVPTGVDLIDFTNAIHTVATATFSDHDFDDIRILDNVQIDGSAGANNIVVSGGAVDASGWTFANWSELQDTITLEGSGPGQAITGSSKADFIIGGLGADTLVGGDGDDTFVYNAFDEFEAGETIAGGNGTGDTLRVNIGTGLSINLSGAGALTGVEKMVFAQAGGVQLSGGNIGVAAGLVNTITGSAGQNEIRFFGSNVDLSGVTFANWTAGEDSTVFHGTSGNDTLIGSTQDDSFFFSDGTDSLSGGGGNDTFSISQNVFGAGASINGGSGIADRMIASFANFSLGTVIGVEQLTYLGLFAGTTTSITLSGTQLRLGAITLVTAGDKDDTLIVKGTSVNLTGVTIADWNDATDTLIINGDVAANSSLVGSSLDDVINGGSANDTINGGLGDDLLKGGLGNDTYVLGAETGDTVTDTGGSADTITSTISRSLVGFGSIEKLTLFGAALNGTGNGLANTILGNANANTLDGKAGGDTLRGLGGNDTYVVDNAGDVVDESVAGSDGVDTVLASASYSLAARALGAVENLTLTGSAATGTGNGLANVLAGNAAANTLDGQAGNDRLVGGLGKDLHTGGIGADTFVFLALTDTSKKKKAADIILDFTAEDFIDVSAIDAKKGGADNRFKFIGAKAFSDKPGQLHFDKKKGDVIVSGDINGDGNADFSILLDDLKKVAKADFVL